MGEILADPGAFLEGLHHRGGDGGGGVIEGEVPVDAMGQIGGGFEHRGSTPLTVTGLRPGEQWVEVRLDGHRSHGEFVTVRPRDEAWLAIELVPRPDIDRYRAIVKKLPGALVDGLRFTL